MDSPGTIRCAFEITFDEFREAVAAIQRVNVQRQQAKQASRPAGWLLPFGAGAAMTVPVLLMFVLKSDPFPEIRPPHLVLFIFLLPSALLLTAVFLLARAQRVRLVGPGAGGVPRLLRAAAQVAPLLVVVGLILLAWLPHASDVDETTGRPVYDWFGTILPHVPWALLMVILLLASGRAQRRQIEQLWEQQPSLSRERTLTVDADGLAFDEAVAYRRYAWVAITRFIETERLLLACPSAVTFELIPKRAFASPAELETARALLRNHVRDPESGPVGFAVVTSRSAGPSVEPGTGARELR